MEKERQTNVGVCPDMCPKSELPQHYQGLVSPFEQNPKTNQFDPSLAIKSFLRSGADNRFNAETVRPLPVLLKTMDHIFNFIIGQRLNTSEKTEEIELYMYLRDRFRAMSSDITAQHLSGIPVIEMYEKIILFFIWSGARFTNFPRDQYDDIMNKELLSNIFIKLDEKYDDYINDSGKHAPSEPLFRALHLLLYLQNENGLFMSSLMKIHPDLIKTKFIQSVISIRKEVISRNIPKLLKLLESTPIQISIMTIQSIPKIYYDTFCALRLSKMRNMPENFFTLFLDIPQNDFSKFCKSFGMKNSEKIYNFPESMVEVLFPYTFLPFDIKNRFEKCSIRDFILKTPKQGEIMVSSKPEFNFNNENAFSFNTPSDNNIIQNQETNIEQNNEPSNKYSNENTENSDNESTENEPEIRNRNLYESWEIEPEGEESKSLPNTEIHHKSKTQSQFEIESSEPPSEEPESQNESIPASHFTLNSFQKMNPPNNPKVMMKLKREIYTPKYFQYSAMIPRSLPKFCFISIVVNDCDNSESAKFCHSHLKSQNDVIFINNFTNDESTVYISIIRRPLQHILNNVGAVLHCEDTTEFTNPNIPCFSFSLLENHINPELALNNQLRKCFEAAIVAFMPMNLTDLVKSVVSSCFDIVLSADWQNATANAVFELFNSVLSSLANVFESELFLKHLLPFIHAQFTLESIHAFAESIRKMKLGLIERSVSRKARYGSTWPIFIRDHMHLTFERPFVAPVCASFDPDTFLALVLDPFKDSPPNEYVIPAEDEVTFSSLLSALDCDMYE
ncbi:hypothetical protein TRFO_07366 [Tritrichomonas foetus]|uniref:SAC3/GANP/THP3 conserved domain-containing protein n=1 Tax=Tritrichomonas foetus TaxID=1144522 RepID=A0A1J4JSU2_9EUKA|nr:hypothetical protein TRFO_07366 [Tritrichomonas foetus]|eukprot:OHT01810.1 hypothetical protein TRFO_07366 [Tritrichomonas foetus]